MHAARQSIVIEQLRQTTRCPLYVLGAPSHFRMEYRHEAAVVSREHMMK